MACGKWPSRKGFTFKRSRFAWMITDARGSAAVEFAIIAPVFLLMVLGMLAFGIYLGAVHSVRQLTSDIARATIPGTTEAERQLIAKSYVTMNVSGYAFIELDNLEINVRDSETVAHQFVVEVQYNAAELPIWGLAEFVPMPSKTITASASIRNGGYVQ